MTNVKKQIKDYYDQKTENKIKDFINGNRRVERAWQKLLLWAPKNPRQILEIGCGLGYICTRMREIWPNARIVGVDISAESIKKAKELFSADGIEFIEGSIPNALPSGEFDLIVLMDVYEHIELKERKQLHTFLNKCLSSTGRVFLSFPTPAFLDYLQIHHPENIQPVDEHVTLNDMNILARDTSSKLLYYRKISVWRPSDYAHAIVSRNSDFFNLKTDYSDFLIIDQAKDNIDKFIIRTGILRALEETLPELNGSLLDLGCGRMPYKPIILANGRITDYIGLDFETGVYAKQQKPDLSWNGKEIPLDDNTVDNVFAIEVFEHIPEPEIVLDEVRRVLTPGGVFFFTIPFLWPLHDVPNDQFRYTPFAFERHLKNSGFSNIALKPLGGWNSALAQMIGLWIKRKPMPRELRSEYINQLFPFYEELLKSDCKSDNFTEQEMFIGISGMAIKPKMFQTLVANSQNNEKEITVIDSQLKSHNKKVHAKPDDKYKIAIIQSGFPAISATFILDQMTGLIDRGLEIENWATYNPNDRVLHPDIRKYRLLENTRYLKFPPNHFRNSVNKWVDGFLTLNKIKRFEDIDAFHVHYGLNFNLIEPLFRLYKDKFVIVSFHGHDASRYFKQYGDSCYEYLFERANLITTPSFIMKNELVKRGCIPDKIRVHRYGVDLKKFGCDLKKDNTSPLNLLTVARLVEKKGIEYSLKAFAALSERKKILYRIIGDGLLKNSLQALATNLRVENQVIFLGAQTKKEVIKEMADADIFLLNSVIAQDGDMEGVPVSLIEAQAMGIPVVSSYHAGIPELVVDGQTGFLTEEKNVSQIVESLDKLISDPWLRRSFSDNAKRRIKDEFDIECLNDRLIKYFEFGINGNKHQFWKFKNKVKMLGSKLSEKEWTCRGDLYQKYFENVEYFQRVKGPAISIVVISWRKHPDTIRNFRILDKQRGQNFELIFVNNGGKTEEFESLKPFINTYVRLNQKTGAYLARNIGALFSQAPIILFLEDDGIPEDNFVQSHIEAHQKYDVIAVRGVCLPKTKENQLNGLARHYFLGDKPFPRHSDLEGNSSYDAQIFFQVGGWDDQIVFGGGGTDLSIRLLKVEPDMRKQIYFPPAVLYHDYAQDEEHLLDKRKRQIESWQLLTRKHPEINLFEKIWNKYFQREDLIVLRDSKEKQTGQPTQKLQNAGYPRHIMFVMYGWNDDGGGTIRPRLLAKELVQRGHTVSVIYAASRKNPLKPDYYVEEGYDDGVQLFGVFNRPTLLSDIENPRREMNDPRMCEIVKKIVSEQHPDIIHYHNLVGFSMHVTEEVNKLNIPAVFTSRNYWPICPRLYLYRDDLSLCAGPSEDGGKCAACIGRIDEKNAYATRLFEARRMLTNNVIRHLAISNRAREIFIDNGFDEEQVYVLHQYPETLDWIWQQTGKLKRSKKSISEPLNVGFLGYVLPQKGVHIMVKALQQFPKEQIAGHIFGDGPHNYIAALKNLDQNDIISFHGGYQPGELPELIASLDLVVVPSVWEETQGVVVLEALAAKIPVIGSRIGGIPDFIEDGFNGFLVEPNDVDHLRDVLSRIVTDPELLLNLQENIQPPRTSGAYIEDLMMHYNEAMIEHQSRNKITANAIGILSKQDETMVKKSKSLTPTKNGMGQKYSLYHVNGREESLKQWMAPYADEFIGCEKVLDIGCGPGLFLELLNERGISCVGFDYDPEMVAICQGKGLNAKVVNGNALSRYSAEFDGIHLGHIIEHMDGEGMVKLLETCVAALRPGGLLLIRTPNWQNETVRSGGFWLDYTHVRPYPLELLDQIYQDLGLDIIRKGYEPGGWNDIYILGKRPGMQKQRYSPEFEDTANRVCQREVMTVRWEGSQFVNHSLALVNRELCIELAGRQDIKLSLIPYEPHEFGPEADSERFGVIEDRLQRPLSGPAEFHVRHQWPPNFTPPPEGHWIMIQPWEFGALPKSWVEPMENLVDELWVPSNHVRDVYIKSGITEDKVFVVPNGVNYNQFNPQVAKLKLNTDKRFKFLFVGGTIMRKGIDVLLSAYAEAFTAEDDVCLVIKDMGGESFYRGQNASKIIEDIKRNPASPEILYLTETLNTEQIAGLYTACDCLVHPYRGEGFGLPVAEAMACALPVIITRGGACDDFCSNETVYFIDSKIRPVQLDNHVLSAQGWLLEPDRAQLIDRLRFVYEHPGQAKEKGALAARQIQKKVDWKISTDIIIERLRALRNKPICRFAGSLGREAAQASKTPQEIYQTIQQSMKDKTPEEVIAELEELTESYPQFALAYNDLGVLYYTAGNKEKARQFYEKAVGLDPDNTVFQKNLADFYFVELGRVEDALRIYITVLEANPKDAETLLIAGHICVALNKFEDAGVFYRRVLELEPWNEAAQNNLDKLAKMNPIAPEPKSPQEMYQEIQSLLNNGDPNKAIAALEEFLQSYPDFALAHNDLGVLYYQTGNKEKTRDHYERATRLMPENINFQKNLADFYCIELGRIEDALRIYVSILKTDPQDVETLMATGLICKALEKSDDAKDFFNRVLQIEPWNMDARKQIEEMERQPSAENLNSESAEDAYRRIQQELPTLIPEEAIVELEKLVELHPNFAIGHNDLGVLDYKNGNKEKALHHYQQAVNLQPENMTLQKNLADFLFVEQGRVEEALKIYVNILTTDPNDVETLLITGHICVALKKFDDAKEFYERVLALEPENEDASKNLQALIMSQRERSLGRPDSINDGIASGAKIESTDLNPEKPEKRQDESKTTVSIIISLDGIQNRVKECFKSIQMHTAEPHELLFVDRGSTKGMLKWARQLVKDNDHYHIIECGRQAGWAESINRAIQKASGHIIVLIHNDVVVPEGWLKAFKMCLKLEPNIGVVGPISNRAAGVQQLIHSDEFDRSEFESAAKAFFEQNQYRRVAARKLSEFCLAFQRELPNKIGYFDEQFFSEEGGVEDFCNRTASGGYQNLIVADTFVYHYDRHPAKKNDSTKNSDSREDSKKCKEKWNSSQNPEVKAFQSALFIEKAKESSQKGQIDQAVEILLTAIGIQPKEQRLYLELAQILLAAKRFKDAKDALIEMLSTAEHQEMRKIEMLGYAEEGLENFDAAQTHVEEMLAINSDHAPALNLKGILAYRNDDRHFAETYFKRAIASDPGYGEPYTNLGMLSLEADQPKDALKFFEKAFRLAPSDLDIATNYHSLIAEIGEYSKAEQLAREAAALYPYNQKIKYMLIDFLIQQGKDEMAMAEIEGAIIKFGFGDGILGASLKLREKLGPMTINTSSNKAPVSLCMIIKNEEKYLARCLASAKPIVDEMIVVDTGSADRSKDIAIAFGAQVYDYDWENDFAAARNFSISKASGQWILILDGDEVISPLDYAHFNRIVSKKPKAPVAYSIITRNYSKLANYVGWVPNDGQYPDEEAAIGWMPSEKVRLFCGKDQIWFEGAVHELVDPVLKRNGIKVKKCSISVHHYGRLDKEKLDRKGAIYFDIGQKKLSEMGEDINALRELAIQATILEKNQEALELWQKLLAVNPHPKLAALAYVNMGTIYNRLEKFDDALDAGKKAVANDPDMKEARYNLAMAELHCGSAQNTIGILEDLLGGFPDYPPAQFILSAAYCCAGQKEKGLDGIRKLKSTPLGAHLGMPCIELARSLLAAKKMEYALCVLGAAIECDIVNKEILDLFTECIQMNDKSQKWPAIPSTGLTEREPIKFENLPQ